MEELRRRLRETADAHEPDRDRILARVERGTGSSSERTAPRRVRRPVPWLRTAGAAVAVAGVLAAGGFAVSAITHETGGHPAGPPAHSSPEPNSPSPSAPSDNSRARVEDGPLWSDGSVDDGSNAFWAQSNVTVKSAKPLTSLTVELRIARTEGVKPTGAWRSLPPDDFTSSTRTEDGFLVYRWELKKGRTAPAGTHVFAGQYDHAQGGRDAGPDRYTATAQAGAQQVDVRGDFAPRKD